VSPKRKEQTAAVTFRVPAELRDQAMARAEERNDNLSELLRDFLRRYVGGDHR
jgi:hypothetical protein